MAAILESKAFGILSYKGGDDYDDCEFSESISDDFSESVFSEEDDASSYSSSSSCSSSSNSSAGPLYDLSSLMEDLPIKKGLSKFFQGKSQSFISLSQVRCIEDLAKKESPYSKRMNSRRRNGGTCMNQKPHYPPNHDSRTISKRSKSNSFSCISKSSSTFTEQKKYLHAFIKEKQGEAHQK